MWPTPMSHHEESDVDVLHRTKAGDDNLFSFPDEHNIIGVGRAHKRGPVV